MSVGLVNIDTVKMEEKEYIAMLKGWVELELEHCCVAAVLRLVSGPFIRPLASLAA